MNLVIDQGNSSTKIALFEQDTIVHSLKTEVLSTEFLQAIVDEYQPQNGMFCSVKSVDTAIQSWLTHQLPVFYNMNHQLALPLVIDYQMPQTLGVDRIAAAVGAVAQKPNQDLLIIDIGTAITIDWVTASGSYKGGNISPGPDLRFKALHAFTGKLPLVDTSGELPVLGYDTTTAIRSGVINGIVRELDSYLDEYNKNTQVFSFLTGGYAFYFESKLKNATFADENLVLKGLNEILNYQQI